MNVKTVIPGQVPVLDRADKTETAKAIRGESPSADRDADGRREHENEQEQRHLSEQEMNEAVEYLKSLPGVKASSLSVEWSQQGEVKVALVKDPTGKVIRRWTDLELSTIKKVPDKKTGEIYERAA